MCSTREVFHAWCSSGGGASGSAEGGTDDELEQAGADVEEARRKIRLANLAKGRVCCAAGWAGTDDPSVSAALQAQQAYPILQSSLCIAAPCPAIVCNAVLIIFEALLVLGLGE